MSLRVVVNGGGTGPGGGGTYVVALARELARGGTRGLDWRFIVSDGLLDLVQPLVPAAPLPAGGAVRRTLREQLRPPIGPEEALVAAAGYGPLQAADRFVLVAHNALHYAPVEVRGLWGARLRVESALARASARRAAAVLTPTDAMADLLRQATGVRALTSPFGPGLTERRGPPPDKRFTFVHRTLWGPHKGFGTLLEAVRRLAARRVGEFVVRSACDPRSAAARAFHESRAERALLEDPVVARHVEFAAYGLGSEEQKTVAGDAVVMPSATESFCFPLAEAITFDLPVVAADRPYAREICGPAAFFAPWSDAASLAAAMERILSGQRPPDVPADRRARLSWARHVDDLAAAVTACSARGSR